MNLLSFYVHKYSCKCTYLLKTLNVKEEEILLKSLKTYNFSNRLERNFTGSDVPKSEEKNPTDKTRRE